MTVYRIALVRYFIQIARPPVGRDVFALRRAARRPATVAAVLVLFLTAALPSAYGSGAPASGPAPATSGPALTPVSHAALRFVLPDPASTTQVGERVAAAIQLSVPNFTARAGPSLIVVPPTGLYVQTVNSTLQVLMAGANVSINGTGVIDFALGPSARETQSVSYPSNGTAILSSQGVALMAEGPFGQSEVQMRAHWVLMDPDGATQNGPWTAWSTIWPAEFVALQPIATRTWVPGGSYPICLSGSLSQRTFSFHLGLAAPGSQVDEGSVTVPASAPQPYCLSATVASSIAPQTAYGHLWEYGNTTYLLYVFQVRIANGTVGGLAPQSPGGTLPSLIVLGLVAAGGIALIVAVVHPSSPLRRKRPSNSPAPALGPSGPDQTR